jgi:serine/threonine protein kinase
MTDPLPEFSGFEIIAELGRGTTGVVYEVHDVRIDRINALKTLAAGDEVRSRNRFLREAQILAGLTRNAQIGIPTLHIVGERQGQYLVREFIEGETLQSAMERHRIDLRSGTRILQRVAEIVSRVHAFHVVHRNLQPSNVLVGTDERVWLIGFGRCRVQDAVRGAAVMTESDVLALQQLLNWLCARLCSDLPDWIRQVQQRSDVASAREFAAVLGEIADES